MLDREKLTAIEELTECVGGGEELTDGSEGYGGNELGVTEVR